MLFLCFILVVVSLAQANFLEPGGNPLGIKLPSLNIPGGGIGTSQIDLNPQFNFAWITMQELLQVRTHRKKATTVQTFALNVLCPLCFGWKLPDKVFGCGGICQSMFGWTRVN